MREHLNGLNRRAFIGGAAALGAASIISPTSAFAETAAEKQAQADAVRNQLIGLQADLEAAAGNYYKALGEQDAAQAAMEDEQGKIDNANSQITELQSKLGTRARSMYRSGSSSFLDFVLGAASFEEFTQNWDLLNQMNENDGEMVNQTKTLREDLQASKEEYARQEQIAADKAAEAKQIQNAVQTKVDQAAALTSTLDAEAKELLEQEQAAAARAAAEQAAAAQAAAAQAADAQASSSSTTSNPSSGGSSGGSSNSGGGSSSGGSSSGGSSSGGSSGGSSSGGSSGGGGGSVGYYDSVVGYATSRIGCPYAWGAAGPNTFDCSGLVVWAYAQVGRYIGRDTEALYSQAVNRVPVSQARPGDVLYRYGHVGIAIGYGGIPYVHAPNTGLLVRDTDSLSWSGFTCALQF